MNLERYREAIEEYVEDMKSSYNKVLSKAGVPLSQIAEECERIEENIEKFLECNEPYGQLLLDINHIKQLSFKQYSLTEIARKKNPVNPSYVIQSWLRDRNTLELLRCWEKEYNSYCFNDAEAMILIQKTKEPSFTLTAKTWIERTSAHGIVSKQGHGGGTYASHEIAIDFLTWVFPEKRYQLSKMIIAKQLMLLD